jgi:D-galactarolactone cycloisomerase
MIRVTTDDGAYGWGQGGQPGVLNSVVPVLVGEDPLETGRLWHRVFQATRGDRWATGTIDIALWDLKGKLTGQSVAQLLGGALRPTVPAYASLHNYTPDGDLSGELTAAIEDARSHGFRGLKFKIGGRPLAEDLRYLRLAREVGGPDFQLAADANQTYSRSTAMRVGRLLQELDYAWYEEPLPTTDATGYRDVSRALDIAIAGYEGTGDPAQIAPVLRDRAIDIYQPDVAGCGGFSVIAPLAFMSTALGVRFTCHVWDSALVQVASLHLLATLPPWQALSMAPIPPPLEVTTLPRQPLNTELLIDPPAIQPDGTMRVPTLPGLGVEVNPDSLQKYAAI